VAGQIKNKHNLQNYFPFLAAKLFRGGLSQQILTGLLYFIPLTPVQNEVNPGHVQAIRWMLQRIHQHLGEQAS